MQLNRIKIIMAFREMQKSPPNKNPVRHSLSISISIQKLPDYHFSWNFLPKNWKSEIILVLHSENCGLLKAARSWKMDAFEWNQSLQLISPVYEPHVFNNAGSPQSRLKSTPAALCVQLLQHKIFVFISNRSPAWLQCNNKAPERFLSNWLKASHAL